MGQPRITKPAVKNAIEAWIEAVGAPPDGMEIRPDGTITLSRKPVDGITTGAQPAKPKQWAK